MRIALLIKRGADPMQQYHGTIQSIHETVSHITEKQNENGLLVSVPSPETDIHLYGYRPDDDTGQPTMTDGG